MQVLLDIKDNKADMLMGLLKDLPYVKIKRLSDNKNEVLEGLREVVEEVKLAKQGKVKLKSMDDFLEEIDGI